MLETSPTAKRHPSRRSAASYRASCAVLYGREDARGSAVWPPVCVCQVLDANHIVSYLPWIGRDVDAEVRMV